MPTSFFKAKPHYTKSIFRAPFHCNTIFYKSFRGSQPGTTVPEAPPRPRRRSTSPQVWGDSLLGSNGMWGPRPYINLILLFISDFFTRFHSGNSSNIKDFFLNRASAANGSFFIGTECRDTMMPVASGQPSTRPAPQHGKTSHGGNSETEWRRGLVKQPNLTPFRL